MKAVPFCFNTVTDGQNNHKAKLTDDIVVEVLLCIRAGMRNPEIALRTGVSKTQVSTLRARRSWTHIRLADRFTPEQLEREIEMRRSK